MERLYLGTSGDVDLQRDDQRRHDRPKRNTDQPANARQRLNSKLRCVRWQRVSRVERGGPMRSRPKSDRTPATECEIDDCADGREQDGDDVEVVEIAVDVEVAEDGRAHDV